LFPKNARSGASRARAFSLVALGCALAAGAAAEDADRTWLKPDLVVEQQWNSNILSRKHDVEGSWVTIIRPSLTFLNEGELGYFFLNGWLANHTYWEESDLNGSDRGGSLRFDRKITPRTDFFGNGSMTRYTDRDEVRGDIGDSGDPTILASGAPDVDYDQGSIGARYRIDARTRSELTAGTTTIDYNRHPVGATTFRDRVAWYANWRLSHQLNPLDTIQLDLTASENDQDSVVASADVPNIGAPDEIFPFDTGDSLSKQQALTLGWERTWTPLWQTSMQIGVRRLDSHVSDASRRAGVPELTFIEDDGEIVLGYVPVETIAPTDFDDVSPALIGTFLVQRAFPRGTLTLSYARETQVNSGALSSDVDVDSVSLNYSHRLSERVTLSLLGEFDYYTSVNDSPQFAAAFFTPVPLSEWTGRPGYTCGGLAGPGGTLAVEGQYGRCEIGSSEELRGQRLVGSVKLDWQMRKRLASYVVFRYYDQKSDPGLLGEDFNKYTIGVGFKYSYDLEL
jgi:hypothetical protein